VGLKYIEQVKSIVLILLILLSFTLTFSVWTYTPVIPTNEADIVDISIAKKKSLEETIRPYRMIISQDNALKGSFANQPIDFVIKKMKTWEIQTVELASNKVNTDQINEFIKNPNRASFFFTADVPIEIFGNILNFANRNFPEVYVNRLIVDWNNDSPDSMTLYFISTSQQKIYSATAENVDKLAFTERILEQAETMQVFNEIVRDNKLSLYVSSVPENILSYNYSIKEVETDKFKDALFNNPSLVRSNSVSMSEQQYTDDSALMNINFSYKSLNYVHPASEHESSANPVDLIQNSLNFVNEHNGWTDDYRYFRMNTATRQINYQLYFAGLPVFSRDTLTEISQYWGVDRVYRYFRPYYSLNVAIPLGTREVAMTSGQAIYNFLSTKTDVNISSIDDLVIGYYLSRDDDQSLFNLEPSWYYLESGSWVRVSPDLLGGAKFGLE
jgi:regulatory protein YycH of two-component signal transduction system YycFG